MSRAIAATLLLSSCAVTKPGVRLDVAFIDSVGEIGPSSAYVCIRKTESDMECLTLREFMRLVRSADLEKMNGDVTEM